MFTIPFGFISENTYHSVSEYTMIANGYKASTQDSPTSVNGVRYDNGDGIGETQINIDSTNQVLKTVTTNDLLLQGDPVYDSLEGVSNIIEPIVSNVDTMNNSNNKTDWVITELNNADNDTSNDLDNTSSTTRGTYSNN